MKLLIPLFFTIVFTSNCIAQKWAIRVGFNNLRSYSDVEVTRLNDQRGDLEIKEGKPLADIMVGNRFYFFPQLSNFWDITVNYTIDSSHGLMAGFRAINPFITSSISNLFGTHTHGEGVTVPTVLLNYSHTILQSKRENPSKLILFGGLPFVLDLKEVLWVVEAGEAREVHWIHRVIFILNTPLPK